MNEICLLGYAPEYVPVIFDVCEETGQYSVFNIYMNMLSDKQPELPFKGGYYQFNLFEPERFNLNPDNEKYIFGVPGPYAKFKVFTDFFEDFQVNRMHYHRIIHPKAIVSKTVEIGNAAFLEPGVIVSSQSYIGFGVTIKRGSSLGHHNYIGDFCEINPGVTISSHVKIGKGCIIGSGAVIKDGISIGANSFIGMGSVVTKDIPSGVVAYGSPCREMKKMMKPMIG